MGCCARPVRVLANRREGVLHCCEVCQNGTFVVRKASYNAMKRWFLIPLALLVTFALVTGCATLDEKQRSWIFQPSDRSWWRGDEAAQGMVDVWIDFNSRETGQPVKLHGLWLAHPDLERHPQAPVLLYLHGARFNVVGSAFRARRMRGGVTKRSTTWPFFKWDSTISSISCKST